MFGLSRKEVENLPTHIVKVKNINGFMSPANQRLLTKKIYLLHTGNNGTATYSYLKALIPRRMNKWVNSMDVNGFKKLTYDSVDMITYLNKLFVTDNSDLYEIIRMGIASESNVYRNRLTIGYVTEEVENGVYRTVTAEKKPEELLAEDIRNLDVWAEQTVEISDNRNRYGNTVPIWQRSLHKRHYDTANQGYHHSDSNRASLDSPVYGYGDEMQKLQQMMDRQLEKQNRRD